VLVDDRLVVLRLRTYATAYLVTTVRAVVGGELRKPLEIRRDVRRRTGASTSRSKDGASWPRSATRELVARRDALVVHRCAFEARPARERPADGMPTPPSGTRSVCRVRPVGTPGA
jgi:hypothetical protein